MEPGCLGKFILRSFFINSSWKYWYKHSPLLPERSADGNVNKVWVYSTTVCFLFFVVLLLNLTYPQEKLVNDLQTLCYYWGFRMKVQVIKCKLFLVVKRRIMVLGIPWTVETLGTTTQRLSVWCAHSLWTACYTEYLIRFLIPFKGKVQTKTDLKRACSYGLHQIIRISPSMCWFG